VHRFDDAVTADAAAVAAGSSGVDGDELSEEGDVVGEVFVYFEVVLGFNHLNAFWCIFCWRGFVECRQTNK